MSRRCVPTRRFDLESLEHRLTPSTSSLLLGLSFSSATEAHGHAGASSHNQASDTFTQAPNTYTLMQAWSQVGLGGLFRQVVVVDHSVRLSFVYIDLGFNTSASFSEYSSLVGNLKTKGDADTKHDKGKDGSATVGRDSDSDSPATPPSNSPGTSPATRQNQAPVVLDDSSTETNDNTPASNSAQTNSTGSHSGGQTVTTSADRNALLFTSSGARNAVLPQDRLDTTTLPLTVNSAQFPLPQQLPIATGPAAAPPRVQLTLPLNGGSNATPVWSCFGWGLPCPRRHRRGGALLPHRFTLTPPRDGKPSRAVGGLLSVALSRSLRTVGVTHHRVL
jgi:hypothetical protein